MLLLRPNKPKTEASTIPSFNDENLTERFISAIPELTQELNLELATATFNETFTKQSGLTTCWDLVDLGTSIVQVHVPVTYQSGVADNCRNAQVVFDKFHVIKNANEAVDKVRRAEVRLGGAGVWEALHKSQWLWRKNPENLTDQEQARLAGIKNKQLATAKAYQMRLVLQDIYRSPEAARHGDASKSGAGGCAGRRDSTEPASLARW